MFEDKSFQLNVGKFSFGAGWYPGENWKLLNINLMERHDGGCWNWLTILDISILKFSITLIFDLP